MTSWPQKLESWLAQWEHAAFPLAFVEVLVWGAIVLAAAGAVTLGVLFLRDLRRKEIW